MPSMKHVIAVPWSDEERDMLKRLHSNGLRHRQIAAMMGRSKHSISRQLQNLGLMRSDRNPAAPGQPRQPLLRAGVKITLPPLPSLRDAD